jgi:hypothetical protein
VKLSRDAYQQLIDGDIAWLLEQKRTLERDHIIEVLKASPEHEYGVGSKPKVADVCERCGFATAVRRIDEG